jgi:hypothetical protein
MKKMRILLCLASFFVLCGLAPTHAVDAEKTTWKLKTQEDAAAATLTYFPEAGKSIADLKESTKLVSFKNDQTPFLRDSINNRPCWEVEIEVILNLTYKVPVDSLDNKVREFTVILDAQTGRLVRISCVLAEDYPHKVPKPPVDTIEWILTFTKELICGFPEEKPTVSFIEALNYVMGSPYGAKEIHAWYVMYSRYNFKAKQQEESHPVWWIDLRGLDPPMVPISHHGRDTPVEWRNHIHSVIDAKTGQHIRSSRRSNQIGGW